MRSSRPNLERTRPSRPETRYTLAFWMEDARAVGTLLGLTPNHPGARDFVVAIAVEVAHRAGADEPMERVARAFLRRLEPVPFSHRSDCLGEALRIGARSAALLDPRLKNPNPRRPVTEAHWAARAKIQARTLKGRKRSTVRSRC